MPVTSYITSVDEIEVEATVIEVSNPGPQGPPGPPGNNKADIALFFEYQLSAAEVLWDYTPSAIQIIGNSAVNSSAFCTIAPTSNTFINLVVDGLVIGNVNFQAANTIGTLDFAQFTLTPSNEFQLVAAANVDPTFGNVRITLSGHR